MEFETFFVAGCNIFQYRDNISNHVCFKMDKCVELLED